MNFLKRLAVCKNEVICNDVKPTTSFIVYIALRSVTFCWNVVILRAMPCLDILWRAVQRKHWMCRVAHGLVLRQLGSILKFTTAERTVSLFFILCHLNKVYMQLNIFCQQPSVSFPAFRWIHRQVKPWRYRSHDCDANRVIQISPCRSDVQILVH